MGTVVKRQVGLVVAGLALVAAAGCGASSEAPSADRAAAPAAEGQQDSAQAAPSKQGVTVPVGSPLDNRSIVYKGELTIRAKRVDEAAAKASTIATGAGGVVSGDNRQSGGSNSSADLILRVPSAKFYDTVNKLGTDLGDELSRGLSTDDVTEAVVDLDARITGQKASVDRTRALLVRAQAISEIVTIEQELARREAELASLQARKRSLSDQVTLSTITLHLIGPRAEAPKDEDEPANFLTGFMAGWDAFKTTVNAALVVFGAMLPFLIALGIPVAVLVVLLRRRRPSPDATAAPPAEG
jgi:Domain of unknown function (DUF4349)